MFTMLLLGLGYNFTLPIKLFLSSKPVVESARVQVLNTYASLTGFAVVRVWIRLNPPTPFETTQARWVVSLKLSSEALTDESPFTNL